MGPNGQAQYWAPTLQQACMILMQHYEYSYLVPGEQFPRRHLTPDPADREKCRRVWRGALDRRRLPYALIQGDWAQREERAVAVVRAIL